MASRGRGVYALDRLLEAMAVLLFVSYSAAFGGAERVLIDVAAGLDGEPCLACPDGALADEARARGIRVFALRGRSIRVRGTPKVRAKAVASLAAHAREARSIVRNVQPDLVLAWGMRSAICCLLPTIRSAPVVFQHNDLLPGGFAAAIVRAAAARAARVIAASEGIARDLDPARRLPPDRLRVVRPGIDVDSFPPPTAPEEPPVVLVLGALVGWKRPDLALQACAVARRSVPNVRLRLVGAELEGDGRELRQALLMRASEPDLAGAVELAGPVRDPRRELARSCCLLHCAPREPFGLAVLEALAAGRPVVAPAAAGPAEIVDESCGWLYPPGDAAAAGGALAELLSEPSRAAQKGACGRARARTQFDRASAMASYADAVVPLARKRPAPVVDGRAGAARAAAEPPSLAVVTVTHNSSAELEALLGSVARHLPGTRVVVVDCASIDGTLTVARSWQRRGSVEVIELGENVGFGRGCNRGLREVSAPVVALLNPDVELLDDSLLSLAGELEAAGAPERLLAPLVLTPSGSREDSAHPAPCSPGDLARVLIPARALPPPVGLAVAPWRANRPRRVGWAVGCALVARTETMRRLGPFDERIFLYGEDLDLGLRAARIGVETWFWPSARVLHRRAHSTLQSFGGEPYERLVRARHEVVARRLGAGRGRLDDLAQLATLRSRLLAKRALGLPWRREQGLLEALRRVRREDL